MPGIELKERATLAPRALQERGVLPLPAGTLTLRLLPPLGRERPWVDELIAALGAVLA